MKPSESSLFNNFTNAFFAALLTATAAVGLTFLLPAQAGAFTLINNSTRRECLAFEYFAPYQSNMSITYPYIGSKGWFCAEAGSSTNILMRGRTEDGIDAVVVFESQYIAPKNPHSAGAIACVSRSGDRFDYVEYVNHPRHRFNEEERWSNGYVYNKRGPTCESIGGILRQGYWMNKDTTFTIY